MYTPVLISCSPFFLFSIGFCLLFLLNRRMEELTPRARAWHVGFEPRLGYLGIRRCMSLHTELEAVLMWWFDQTSVLTNCEAQASSKRSAFAMASLTFCESSWHHVGQSEFLGAHIDISSVKEFVLVKSLRVAGWTHNFGCCHFEKGDYQYVQL